MKELSSLYTSALGHAPAAIEKMKGAGSNREYYRLFDADGRSVVGVVGTSREENDTFVYLAKHFRNMQLAVPEVVAVSNDGMRYLQEDLGGQLLFDALSDGRNAGGNYNDKEKELLVRTIRELPRIQIEGAKGLDFSRCYPLSEFNRESIFFDLNYFKYCFLKPVGVEFNEVLLEQSFHALADDLLADDCSGFMYRDFQARNVMLRADGSLAFIDFQGGRRGPVYYDVASFLWQASAKYGNELRSSLIKVYFEELAKLAAVPSEEYFLQRLQLFVFFRTLQVLGAYGFRGYFERKKHFLDSILPAIQNLRELLSANEFPYKYLVEVLCELVNLPRFASKRRGSADASTFTSHPSSLISHPSSLTSHPSSLTPHPSSLISSPSSLTVRVFSFSYKKGIPGDESGNGGGYVFDCRSTHNPGRYEPYKHLTGLDEPVIRFLEDDGEMLKFLESVYLLADAHVERYIERGFTDLMFSFGCTGGQHRSVYSAQHLAEHLHRKYGIAVKLVHREQGIEQNFK